MVLTNIIGVQGDVYFGRVTDFIIGNGLLFYAQAVIPGSDPESVEVGVLDSTPFPFLNKLS